MKNGIVTFFENVSINVNYFRDVSENVFNVLGINILLPGRLSEALVNVCLFPTRLVGFIDLALLLFVSIQ